MPPQMNYQQSAIPSNHIVPEVLVANAYSNHNNYYACFQTQGDRHVVENRKFNNTWSTDSVTCSTCIYIYASLDDVTIVHARLKLIIVD